MRLRVLGGMDVRCDGEWVPVAAPLQRVLLALLLVESGSPVTMDRLVDGLWPERRPERPERQVHMLVWRIRRLLGDRADALQTVRPGYRLDLGVDESDAGTFDNLHRRGEAFLRDGDPAAAIAPLTEALGLWRGSAYADVRSFPGVAAEAVRLDDSRLAARESLFDAELRRGRHQPAVAQLRALASEHPFRERLHALLMTALSRSGRQVEALEVYQTIHHRLSDELGIQPGSELREVHRQILGPPPEPSVGPTVLPAEADVAAPTPYELPPGLSALTGRGEELGRLLALASAAGGGAGQRAEGGAVTCVLDGMPGIGKTALAVHAAHRLAGSFPDGQLFVDLHGFTAGVPPVTSAAALDRLLRSLGVPAEQITAGEEERAALWRSRTAHGRYLLVLDDAVSGDQVRPLLPASPTCAVIVTSRRRLGELDDAVPISLEQLPPADVVALFRSIVGADRLADVPPDMVEQAARMCGLPLAVRLLASRLRNRPGWGLRELVDGLRDDRRQLVELDVGGRSVAAAFRLSYDHLESADRRLFCLLGLHPGADFDVRAAAALGGLDSRAVEPGLERLVDAHLLEARGYGRYALHDLLRVFAAEVAEQDELDSDRAAAVGRLLDYHLCAAAAAMDAYAPAEAHRRPDVAALAAMAGLPGRASFDDERAALRWLDAERANLVAGAGRATEVGRPEHTWALAGCLDQYLQNSAHYADARELADHHMRAARQQGTRVEEGRALLSLGGTHYRAGEHATASERYRDALDCLPDGPREDRARVLYNLGLVLEATAELAGAREQYEEAARAFCTLGDVVGEIRTSSALARVSRYLGRLDEATEHGRRALEAARGIDDRQGASLAHYSLGILDRDVGRYEDALAHLGEALRLRREIGNRPAEALTLAGMCGALRGLGRYEEAVEHGRRSLAIAEDLANQNAELDARQEVGETLRVSGRPEPALGELHRALELADALTQPVDQVRAHRALSEAYRGLGDHRTAGRHRERARELDDRHVTTGAEPARPARP